MALRVVSYNVLDGGVGRADPLAEVLIAQRPDVAVLVEADDAEVRDRVAWRLGFDHVAAVGRKGRTAAVLTRGRILDSANLARDDATGPRSLLLTTLELDGRQLGVAGVHLSSKASDARETRREREVAVLLGALRPWRDAGLPHVVCGDFNATSPTQQIDPARLPDKVRPHFEANGDAIPRRAIQSVLDAGYADAHAAARPGEARAAASFTTLEPGMRLDYVFCHGVEPADGWVERDRLATYASDHYPVGAELR